MQDKFTRRWTRNKLAKYKRVIRLTWNSISLILQGIEHCTFFVLKV